MSQISITQKTNTYTPPPEGLCAVEAAGEEPTRGVEELERGHVLADWLVYARWSRTGSE